MTTFRQSGNHEKEQAPSLMRNRACSEFIHLRRRSIATAYADLPAADGESSAGGAGAGAASAGAYGAAGAAHPGGQVADAGAAHDGPFGAHAAAGAAQLGLAEQHFAVGAAHEGFIEHRFNFGSFGRQSFGRFSFGMHNLGSSNFGSLRPDGQPQSPASAGTIWNDKAAAVSNATTECFMEVSPNVKVGT
jgi:hypothetical protein